MQLLAALTSTKCMWLYVTPTPPGWCVACRSYIRIYAGLASGTSNSGFLTAWLSTGANYTTTGTQCAGMIGIMAGVDAIVTCPSVTGAQYATIERRDTLTADPLVVHELQIFRTSE